MEDQLLAFLEFLTNERNYSANTIAAYRNDLSQFLAWLTTNYPEFNQWSSISFKAVSEYSDYLKPSALLSPIYDVFYSPPRDGQFASGAYSEKS